MASSGGRIFLTFLLLHVFTTTTCICCSRFPAIFTFGDTLVDSGNNNFFFSFFKADHAPYGQSFPGRVSTGRFSDGKLIADFLASSLNIKDAVPPFLDPNLSKGDLRTGVSFGSAGSGLDDLTSSFTKAIPVSRQPKYFQKYIDRLIEAFGDNVARDIIGNALVLVMAGSDDFVVNFYTAYTRQFHYGLVGYQDFLLQKIQDLIKTLYNMGCRNFLVAGIPPIGCKPKQITETLRLDRRCVEDENRDAESYNLKLQGFLIQIQSNLLGSKLVYADIFTPFIDMIKNPLKYGLMVTNKGCCGTGLLEAGLFCKELSPVCQNPAQYLFWDSAYPTEYTNRHLAQFLEDNALPLFPIIKNTTGHHKPKLPTIRANPPH